MTFLKLPILGFQPYCQGDISMDNNLLTGLLRWVVPVPRVLWQWQISLRARQMDAGLEFMSAEHHQVRNFVVREIPRIGEPLSPDFIAESLSLPLDQTKIILDDLEAHMTFLYRNDQGAVAWAYPVTADETPHLVTLSTGEQVHAA
jgi:hypothetical protein